jgi:hypothetical protein
MDFLKCIVNKTKSLQTIANSLNALLKQWIKPDRQNEGGLPI